MGGQPEPTAAASRSKAWELGKDILAIAVIPLVGWVINLSVQNALRDEHIKGLQAEVAKLDAEQARIDAVKDDVQKANI